MFPAAAPEELWERRGYKKLEGHFFARKCTLDGSDMRVLTTAGPGHTLYRLSSRLGVGGQSYMHNATQLGAESHLYVSTTFDAVTFRH